MYDSNTNILEIVIAFVKNLNTGDASSYMWNKFWYNFVNIFSI